MSGQDIDPDRLNSWFSEAPEVPKDFVQELMESESLEIRGWIADILARPRLARKITPEVSEREYMGFLNKYVFDCIRLDPKGDWSDSPYTAGYMYMLWFFRTWKSRGKHSELLVESRDWLGKLYINGCDRIREVLVNGILEHLLQHRSIRRFFGNWRNDPILSQAYLSAVFSEDRPPRIGSE